MIRRALFLLAATRHLLQHPQGHRPFTLAVTGRAPTTLYGRPYSTPERCEIYSSLITMSGRARAHASGAVPAAARARSGR